MTKLIYTAFLLMFSLAACSQKQAVNDNSSLLLGKWDTQKVEGKHRFNDGNVSIAATEPHEGDFLKFEIDKVDNGIEHGSFTTVQYGMNESGAWEYNRKTKELKITYTSFEPYFTLFRKVEKLDKTSMVLTADDALIQKWLTTNKLMVDSEIKIVGGSFFEQYAKSKD